MGVIMSIILIMTIMMITEYTVVMAVVLILVLMILIKIIISIINQQNRFTNTTSVVSVCRRVTKARLTSRSSEPSNAMYCQRPMQDTQVLCHKTFLCRSSANDNLTSEMRHAYRQRPVHVMSGLPCTFTPQPQQLVPQHGCQSTKQPCLLLQISSL